MAGHTPAGRQACQNCDSPLTGPYCSQCGQHDIDYHRSFGPVVEDALEGFLHFDGRFLKTVRYLFARPGFLTSEFIAGRRTTYTNPLRFYIFASFLYFASALIPQAPPGVNMRVSEPTGDRKALLSVDTAPEAPAKVDADAGSIRVSGGLASALGLRGAVDRKAIGREIAHLLPTMLFFCVPFLALALEAAYRRSGKVYIEHLVFALHVQALVFLASIVSRIVEWLVQPFSPVAASFAGTLFFLAGSVLVLRALRAVYGGRWAKTLLKSAFVGAAYSVVLIFGTVVVSLASVYVVSREG